jgi:photosystem II stability/assembly factor-like uncharacterized protein
MHRNRLKTRVIVAAGLLMIVAGAVGARGAVQGVARTGAPNWLSLFGVAIQPDNTIFIVGSKAMLLTSTDQGKSWLQRTLKEREGPDLLQDSDLYGIHFIPGGKVGWIVGEDGVIQKTTDGGDTWTRQESPNARGPEEDTARERELHKMYGIASQKGDSGTKPNLYNLYPIDDQTVVAVGADGAIIRTADGGEHWQLVKSPKLVSLFDVTFVDKNTGFAVGEFSTIITTVDGGQTWTLNYGGNTSDYTIGPYFSVTFSDPQNGIASGLAGNLMVTADGGKTWKAQQLPGQTAGYVVTEDAASKKLWVAGAGGLIFDKPQGGEWQALERTAFHDISSLAFAGDLGVAVGLNGTILISSNAGAEWRAIP